MGAPAAGAAADPAWERRHPDDDEWWSFDFWTPNGALGGFVGLTLWGSRRPAWYWAALVGEGRPYLLVRELEVAPPRLPASREVRADGLWADLNCETPLDHWSVGLEALAVALDDPEEALGAERGDRTGLGLDLEWEAAGAVLGGAGAYEQPCTVHGEVLVGAGTRVETIGVDGLGWRRHGWGRFEWAAPRAWVAGRTDGGRPYRAEAADATAVEVLRRAPLRLARGRRSAVLERALCRFRAPDGPGTGWCERVAPGAGTG